MAGIRQRLEWIAATLLSGDYRVLTAPGKPDLAYGIAQLVNSKESLEKMLHALSCAKQLAVDAEGISLGRAGKLCLLSLSPAPPPDTPSDTPTPVFLLDVSTLSTAAFTHKPPHSSHQPTSTGPAGEGGVARSFRVGPASNSSNSGPAPSQGGGPGEGGAAAGRSWAGAGAGAARSLKDVLECEQVTKLFYDVRCDSEALFHQHHVRLKGVVDLQLSEVAYRRYGPAVRRVGYVVGLKAALERYLDPVVRQRWQATAVDKRLLHAHFQQDPQYWDRRPLTEEQVRYAADDVLYLHHLHREFSAALSPPILERVSRFSEYRVMEGQQAGGCSPLAGRDPARAQAPPGL